ncbi:MAG TPA: NAD(P)/FAD-dependent oxidoreductase, partial [Candidatus Micrarchaeota archaeon]|nr:NAD(P)/FAD-dependent oxidoreductase [Candidatus Micrarchaeota archaeon]
GEFDVAIIGSGPAGSHAALCSAQKGLDVAVFEEHKMAGEPVHCGECLSDLAISKFKFTLPPEAVSAKVKGVRVIFPDGHSTVLNESGVVLEKHAFEQHISKRAEESGAKYFYSSRVNGLSRHGGAWGISAGAQKHSSKIIIDASGVAQAASKMLAMEQESSTVLGAQYLMEDIPQDGYLDFYLWPRLAPNGYLWMIPKSDGRANVGLVTDEKAKVKAYLNQFVKDMGWDKKKTQKSFGGLIPSSGPLPQTYDDGLMIVGDAAGFTSPLFEGGTHLGLMSGKFAADVAAMAVSAKEYDSKVLCQYERLWSAEFPDYSKLIAGKDALYSFTDSDLGLIGRSFPKELSSMSVFDKAGIFLKIMAGNPK